MARKHKPEEIIGKLSEAEARRLKDLEKEGQRLRKAVSDLTLDAQGL